jgi:hypothetical protein
VTPRSSRQAADLLAALRAAGSHVWIDAEGDLLCSPPLRHVDWPDDSETAIETHYDDLRALVMRECSITVH